MRLVLGLLYEMALNLTRCPHRILPLMTLAYLMQAMDKSTTGTASIMGLLADTNMVGQDYALTSTFLWCGVIVGELPANRIVQMLPVAKLLSGALILWGIVSNWQFPGKVDRC